MKSANFKAVQRFFHVYLPIAIIVFAIIWIGAMIMYFVYGHNSIYQIWFFINIPFLLCAIYFKNCTTINLKQDKKLRVWAFDNQPTHMILLLLISVMVTLIYGNIENPRVYTFSMIGNLNDPTYYILF